MDDMVNHPAHYKANASGVECIDVTKHMNFCLGNAFKYLYRRNHKHNPVEDMKKAIWYLNAELERRGEDYPINIRPQVTPIEIELADKIAGAEKENNIGTALGLIARSKYAPDGSSFLKTAIELVNKQIQEVENGRE